MLDIYKTNLSYTKLISANATSLLYIIINVTDVESGKVWKFYTGRKIGVREEMIKYPRIDGINIVFLNYTNDLISSEDNIVIKDINRIKKVIKPNTKFGGTRPIINDKWVVWSEDDANNEYIRIIKVYNLITNQIRKITEDPMYNYTNFQPPYTNILEDIDNNKIVYNHFINSKGHFIKLYDLACF